MHPGLDVMEPDALFGNLRFNSFEGDTVVIARHPRMVLL